MSLFHCGCRNVKYYDLCFDAIAALLPILSKIFFFAGRTMVHHAVKRFLIILPAIFFKLGIAFTLLIVVALAAVNNGFIGFLLLVVGLSSVLARLQDTRRAAIPYISPLPPYHQHVWDRSDSSVVDRSDNTKAAYYAGYVGQNQQYNPALTNYYSKYTTSKV
jgi:hypothetical protein